MSIDSNFEQLLTEIYINHMEKTAPLVKGSKIDLYDTDNKYDIIYADPPWKQSKGGKQAVKEFIDKAEEISGTVLTVANGKVQAVLISKLRKLFTELYGE